MNFSPIISGSSTQSFLDSIQSYYFKKNSAGWSKSLIGDNSSSQAFFTPDQGINNNNNYNQMLLDTLWSNFSKNTINSSWGNRDLITAFLSMNQRVNLMYNYGQSMEDISQSDLFQSITNNWFDSLSGSQGSIATISVMGVEINNISQALEKTGDQNALAGFKKTMLHISQRPADLQNMNFIRNVDNLASGNQEMLKDVFSTINALDTQKSGISLSTYMDTFNTTLRTIGTAGLPHMNTSINRILSAQYDDGKNMSSSMTLFFNIYNGILNSGDNADIMSRLNDFAADIGNLKNGSVIFQYLASYQIKM